MAEVIPSRSRRDSQTRARDANKPHKPPAHLSARSRGIWKSIVAEWVIGPEALPILRAGLEQLDLYDMARAELVRDGLTTTNPETGMVRAHPAAKIAQDTLSSFRQCFRQLGLQPPEDS